MLLIAADNVHAEIQLLTCTHVTTLMGNAVGSTRKGHCVRNVSSKDVKDVLSFAFVFCNIAL